MSKIMAIIALVAAIVPAGLMAAENAPAETRLRQAEEIGAARGRLFYKMEELRRSLVAAQRTTWMRYSVLQEKYQNARTSIANKSAAENAKPVKEQATIDALAAKLQKMDEYWSKTFSPAYTLYTTRYNELNAFIISPLTSVTQLNGYDDYMNRTEMDLQPLLNVLLAIDVRADAAKAKVTEMTTEYYKALDQADVACNE